jgi:hypothetical protein
MVELKSTEGGIPEERWLEILGGTDAGITKERLLGILGGADDDKMLGLPDGWEHDFLLGFLDGELTEVIEVNASSATNTGSCWHVHMGPEVMARGVMPKKGAWKMAIRSDNPPGGGGPGTKDENINKKQEGDYHEVTMEAEERRQK